MSPEFRNWNVVEPKRLQTDIKDFIESQSLNKDFLIQKGFYLLRNPQTKCFTRIVLCLGSSEEISENQKKQALKQNSDWFLIHGIQDCSKVDNHYNKLGLKKHKDIKQFRGKHRSHTKGPCSLFHSGKIKFK